MKIDNTAAKTDPVYKIADQDWEFELIHQLNYRTFVEEIPQHARNASHRLVDKFHDQNTYLIALRDQCLLGMLALRKDRPFSLDAKIKDLDSHLPRGRLIAEVRLLAIDPQYRNREVLTGLLDLMHAYCVDHGIDMAVISGTVRQQKLYSRMGFTPFGPVVGEGQALYQPMYVAIETFRQYLPRFQSDEDRKNAMPAPLNLLPGPVSLHPSVQRAFSQSPVSHRSDLFRKDLNETRALLCELTGANYVQIMQGGGTLANDVVALQLAAMGGPGLVLSNGEFGERLIDHASRAALPFESLSWRWGEPFDYTQVELFADRHPELRWMWATHCETSTGILNDLERLLEVCRPRGIQLCVDCTSTIGTLPMNLREVYLASGSSGKGLASFPGLALVFSQRNDLPSRSRLPRCLDLGYYMLKDGMPYTLSSNLVYALSAALKAKVWRERFTVIRRLMSELRAFCEAAGLRILADEQHGCPAVATLVIPGEIPSTWVGAEMEKQGFLLSCNSDYLIERNWIQVCLMGESIDGDLDEMVTTLCGLIQSRQSISRS